MSRARLIITAVVVEGRPQAAVARDYGVSKGWVSKLVARYRVEGDAAFGPRSRHPHTRPDAEPLTEPPSSCASPATTSASSTPPPAK